MPNPKREVLPLPADLTPDDFVCFQIKIPKNVEHYAAFWGALDALAHRYNWGKPLTADSSIVASYWRNLIEENRECFEGALNVSNNNCGCCDDPIYRFNSAGVKEVSHDGGETWEEDIADPRISGSILPPPLWLDPDGDNSCNGALTGAANMKILVDEIIALGDAGATAIFTEITTLICVMTAGAACAVAALISGLAILVLQITTVYLNSVMTEEVYDQFKCLLFCRIQPDASFSAAGIDLLKSDIMTTIENPDARMVLWNIVHIAGAVGLTNMCRLSIAPSGDCDDCACETCDINAVYLYNFATATWALAEPETDNTIVLTSSTEGSRQYLRFAFGAPNGTGDCCNVVSYEQLSGNAIFLVEYMDCALETFTQALPTAGCRTMVTIMSQVMPEPEQVWRITLGEDCLD